MGKANAPGQPATIRVGQVWLSLDRRENGRRIMVVGLDSDERIELQRGRAKVVAQTILENGELDRRQTRILVERLRPGGSTGWVCLHVAADGEALCDAAPEVHRFRDAPKGLRLPERLTRR